MDQNDMSKKSKNTTAKNIDSYLSGVPIQVRVRLEKIRQTIKKAVPNAEEVISYQMPAFKFHGILVWFAAFKNHYSLFTRPKFLQVVKNDLKKYETSKSAIRFPLNEPVPVQLVTKIVKLVAKENLQKAQLKATMKK